jgi:hypothetical protein
MDRMLGEIDRNRRNFCETAFAGQLAASRLLKVLRERPLSTLMTPAFRPMAIPRSRQASAPGLLTTSTGSRCTCWRRVSSPRADHASCFSTASRSLHIAGGGSCCFWQPRDIA